MTFGYTDTRTILEDASFSVRAGSKVTIMGQNGAGKSSIINLLCKKMRPNEGTVNVKNGETVAVAKQTMPLECRSLDIRSFFDSQFEKNHSPGPKLEGFIAKVLKTVSLDAPLDRIVKSFSGGQQARLLLAAALITEPSILLLDEPTNNLDHDGIERLRSLILTTEKTVIVISHDEDFLNSFTDSVLYLDMFKKCVEMYDGDYTVVKKDIATRMIRENSNNTRIEKDA